MITKEQFEAHAAWLKDPSQGSRIVALKGNLSGANLSGANLSRANLSETNLSGANLSRANLSETDLSRANLSETNLSETDLSRANLSETNLIGANLIGANLIGANLSETDLSGANLSETDLSETDLSGANLSETDLSGADLSGANLSGANLSETDLSETDLSRAVLCGAKLPSGIPVIPEIHRVLAAAIKQHEKKFDMLVWHCGTSHCRCRAGWVVALAGEPGLQLERQLGTNVAAALIYAASDPNFVTPNWYENTNLALADIFAQATTNGCLTDKGDPDQLPDLWKRS